MRYLIVCQHISGQIAAIARFLSADPANSVGLASHDHEMVIPGARRIMLRKTAGSYGGDLQELWGACIRRAVNARSSFEAVRKSGFYPQIMLVQAVNGAALYLKEVFPEAFMLEYVDAALADSGGHALYDIMARIENMQLMDADLRLASFDCQLEHLPEILASGVERFRPFVDTDYYTPCGAPEKLAGIIAGAAGEAELRDIWKLAVALALHDPSLKVCIHARGTSQTRHFVAWKKNLDPALASRIYARSSFSPPELRKFARMAGVVYCPRPSCGNIEGLMALMSCGALLLAPASQEFFRPELNMLPAPGSLQAIFQSMLKILAKRPEFGPLCRNARRTMLERFPGAILVPEHIEFIRQRYADWREGGSGKLGNKT